MKIPSFLELQVARPFDDFFDVVFHININDAVTGEKLGVRICRFCTACW